MLSIITITARVEPHFAMMAESIAAAGDLEWVVVDALLWTEPVARRAHLAGAVAGRFPVTHVSPKPTRWQGPTRDPNWSPVDRPDHNNARNTGLIHARGDFVLFLDDCSVLYGPWRDCVTTAERDGVGMALWFDDCWDPRIQPTTAHAEYGMYYDRDLLPTNMRGSGVGAPLEAFLRVEGFDEICGGLAGDDDIECWVRLRRSGLPLVGFAVASVAELRAGHGPSTVPRTRRFPRHIHRLMADANRCLPYAEMTPCSLRLARALNRLTP